MADGVTGKLQSHSVQGVNVLGRWVGWWGFCAALLACSPTYNWRQVRPADFALHALLPCKPQAAQRTVGLGEQTAELHMLSCDAGGLTFALSALRMPNNMNGEAVLQGWKQASLASLKLPLDKALVWQLPVQPKVAATGWRAEGARHDGTAVTAHAVMLVHGSEVFQVAVYGVVAPEVLTELLEGLQLDAAP